METIEMPEYRTKVIEYFASRAPEQHVHVAWETMGTGKTLTAIVFLQNFSDKYQVNIVTPEGIGFVWRDEFRRFGFSQENIRYHTYADLLRDPVHVVAGPDEDGRPSIVVLDEVHTYIALMKNTSFGMSARRDVFVALQRLPRKVLGLTGTLLPDEIADIRFILGLEGPKVDIPYTKHEFNERFFATSTLQKALHGYFIPAYRSDSLIVVYISSALTAITTFSIGYMYLRATRSRRHAQMKQQLTDWVNKWRATGREPDSFMLHQLQDWMAHGGEVDLKAHTKAEWQELRQAAYSVDNNPEAKEQRDKRLEKEFFKARIANFQVNIPLVQIVLAVFAAIIVRGQIMVQPSLRVKALRRAIQPYISYYVPEYLKVRTTPPSLALKQRQAASIVDPRERSLFMHFPRLTLSVEKMELTKKQFGVFMRFTANKLTGDDAIALHMEGAGDLEGKINALTSSIEDVSLFSRIGQAIGMVPEDGKSVSPKVYRALEITRGSRAVIYSRYDWALDTVQRELARAGRPYVRLRRVAEDQRNSRLAEFSATRPDLSPVVLLDTEFQTGVTIKETPLIVMLEPVPNISDFEQIVARVRRYKSMELTPLDSRHVRVVELVSSTSTYVRRLRQMFDYWLEGDRSRGWWAPAMDAIFKREASPDGAVYANRTGLDRYISQLRLNENDASKLGKEGGCRIWLPPGVKEEKGEDEKKPDCREYNDTLVNTQAWERARRAASQRPGVAEIPQEKKNKKNKNVLRRKRQGKWVELRASSFYD